jgi:hypothetical protein
MKYGWSLDINEWKALQALLSEVVWHRAYLDPVHRERVSCKSGIYVICAVTDGILNIGIENRGLKNAVYIGQSTNLQRRFSDHVRGYGNVIKAKEIFRRLEFLWTEIHDEKLDIYEQALVGVFGPSANEINIIRAKIGQPIRL